MAGASLLAVECGPAGSNAAAHRLSDASTESLDEALAMVERSCQERRPLSVGLLGNAAEVFPELVRRGARPDVVTDQTSAHDPLNGYLPAGWTLPMMGRAASARPQRHRAGGQTLDGRPGRGDGRVLRAGVPTLDYGNNIRQMAKDEGLADAFAFPGFVPAYIRPLFCRGVGPFRWVALSGDPEDIHRTDAAMKRLFPDNAHLHRWLDMAGERIAFQGLPARICWIGLGDRHRAGLMFNEMVASGERGAHS